MHKILLIADIHHGESKESWDNPGIVRQANSQAQLTLEQLIPKINEKDLDVVVQMGDLTKEIKNQVHDRKLLQDMLSELKTINHPIINLLGNHEYDAYLSSYLAEIFEQHNFSPNFYGEQTLGNFQLIWLDHIKGEEGLAYLHPDRLSWLKETINPNQPTILFSHYSLVPIDAGGSFYFQPDPRVMHYTNHQEIREVLENNHTVAAFNAHVHLLSYKQINGIHYVANQAFSENFAGEKFKDNNPGIYSVLELDDNELRFKSYSSKFAFANFELKI